jgi:hypothetical protein
MRTAMCGKIGYKRFTFMDRFEGRSQNDFRPFSTGEGKHKKIVFTDALIDPQFRHWRWRAYYDGTVYKYFE